MATLHRPSALLLALAFVAPPTPALRADRSEPADIDAQHYSDDPENGRMFFREQVLIRQGTLEIRADEAIVMRTDAGEMTRVLLTGDPVTWEEQLDGGDELAAQARRIDYRLDEERVVLEGDVVVDRGTDRIAGETIRYDLATSRLDAGGEGERVRMTITPQRKPDTP